MRRSITILALALGCVAPLAVHPSAQAEVEPQTPARGPVTYTRDVAPILFQHCVTCHRPGEFAPFPLLTYDDARQRARLIVEATSNHVMPPWKPDSECCEFEGDRRLGEGQIATIQQWLSDGLVEGDAADLPPPPSFSPGWQLGRPDLIVQMDQAYVVPAGGPDVFRNFALRVPVRMRRYVQAVEFRPGNPRVLHHARVLIDESGDTRRRDAQEAGPGFGGMDAPGARFPDGHFIGWAPGKLPKREVSAWPIEPGTDLVVQMHLKPTGRPEPVQVSIGLYFTDTPPSVGPVMLRLGSRTIDIPAGEPGYEISDTYVLPVDATILRVYPHAHYLGRDMTVQAVLPDGETRGLFHIADWDFNWQDEYVYARPMTLPRGARIEMRYRYDNSTANAHNPHSPPQRVRFGPLTGDEMGELLVQLMPASAEAGAALRTDVMRKALAGDIAGEEKRVADWPDDYETRNALGVHYMQAGRTADARQQFLSAIALRPDHAVSHYNLGVIAMGAQQYADAASRFERALASRPDYVEAHTNLAVLLEAGGRPREAVQHYRAALASNADHLAALNNLARLLALSTDASVHDPDEAVKRAERANELAAGQNIGVLDTLASAYAAAGRMDFAVRTARAAFERAMATGNEALARQMRERLEIYTRGAGL